jgi:prepilin signal peptidase PulO-like enzyme (type II secretory pathway)
MENAFLGTLSIVIVTTLIVYLLHKTLQNKYHDWAAEDRGFTSLKDKFQVYSFRSLITGTIFGSVLGIIFANIYIGILLGITLYALVFSTQTDLKVHKAPKEISNFSIIFSMPVVITSLINNYYNTVGSVVVTYSSNNEVSSFLTKGFAYMEGGELVLNQVLNFIFWMIIPVLLFLLSRGGLGMADIRLFFLLGVTTSWWVGIIPMMLIFFIANVAQIISFFPAKKRNLGEMVTLDNGKKKFAVPFIPAITLGYLLGILTLSITVSI